MSATSFPLSTRRERPVDPVVIEILRHIDTATAAAGVSYFVVGALARDLVLTHVYGIDTGRATKDTDIAIAVANWDQFAQIKRDLNATGSFIASRSAAHRLIFRPISGLFQAAVDLIPFGGVEQANGTIAWPPELAEVMSVIGFRDVEEAAVAIDVDGKGLVAPVASLPGLAIMKLLAWGERGHEDPKDAIDFMTLLRFYADAGQLDRLYGPEEDALRWGDFDPPIAGALLLGRDVRRIARPQTLARLRGVVGNDPQRDQLVTQMARRVGSIDFRDNVEVAERFLLAFTTGLQ